MTSVTELILSSYQLAAIQQGTVTGAWITGSHILGGALPGSLLSLSIQRAGRLDTVLRCMEDEFTSVALVEGIFLGRTELLVSLSEAWVGQVYEIVRLSKERELIASSDFFQALEGDFRLLRIPLNKHEIAKDKKLAVPLSMSRTPSEASDVDYQYDKTDRLRSHIMPIEISSRGSIQWCAIDISATLSQRWIERRDLADRFLQLLNVAESQQKSRPS